MSKDALFVGIANSLPTMPVRRCANIEPLGLRGCCKLLLIYNGIVCVRDWRRTKC